jgi:RNA polymerase sigma-70 factor (ECF subfamily)
MESPEGQVTQIRKLLDLAARGEHRAYDDIIALASERLLKLTRKMLRGYSQLQRWEQTDDVFQNAAMRLHKSLKKLRPDSPRAFFGLATLEIRRTLIDLCRHHFGPEGAARKHQSDIKDRFSHNDRGLLQNKPDEHDDESLEAWSRFHEAVERLPEAEREIVHFVWYGGMTQAEVASVLGVSVPTVKRRWYRARLQLQTTLEEQPPLSGECR